ncbi:PREDICTED: tetratricopeptide repeat protein 12-like [Ceratosolen solmsi marchali]|uniref:Tetratricopeptide repeat protein 12-like n=1 Tax=Ceratosolen solmsi marchali TaxID=326594 RepID=A0AAJ6VLA3_9HYME|nr:PREDICTED: tetratricopeptide repeat protein 12-like [Ceratosolen solmsi marchali]
MDNNMKDVCLSNLSANGNVTEEEFQNFMYRVTEVDKIVKQLASSDVKEQQYGMLLADEILKKKDTSEISENVELKIKSNRTIISKYPLEDLDPKQMSQDAFKLSVERDANKRAEDRKIRNELSETYKHIGNTAFKQNNFEKAITYFSKALEQRKDTAVLWNNRALSYMKFGLYEKALYDCEWALKVNENNIKALLNSARCHKLLGNYEKCKEFIALARTRNPKFQSYISEFEENLHSEELVELGPTANSQTD